MARQGEMDLFQADHPKTGLDKIRSNALRREVMSHEGAAMTVVVEVDLPKPAVEIVKPQGSGDPRAARFNFAGPELDPLESARRFDDARLEIESITGRPPETVLAYSGSLVVEASGEQIREIAELPSVAAIWSNEIN